MKIKIILIVSMSLLPSKANSEIKTFINNKQIAMLAAVTAFTLLPTYEQYAEIANIASTKKGSTLEVGQEFRLDNANFINPKFVIQFSDYNINSTKIMLLTLLYKSLGAAAAYYFVRLF